jgi:glycosyltransferase involved in cell wall biosynthesis
LAKQDFANLRKQWDIPQEAFCFLYAGKLQDKKRPLDLLVALQKACYLTSYPIHLLIVGSGSLENECKTFTQIHKLPVSFVGFLNQTGMPKAYAVSNCIVLPSDQGETWGLVINEAMACGLPAITSDLVGCAPDLISDGFTGFSYTCGDSDTLAKYLVYMAENEDQAREMGNNAQKLINSEYTLEKVVASIELAMARING